MIKLYLFQYLTVYIAFSAFWLNNVCSVTSQFLTKPQPRAFSENNRILTLLLSHNLNHFESVNVILSEYVAICEGGWNVTVSMLTHANYTQKLQRLVTHKTYCSRIDQPIKVIYETTYNISTSRTWFAHRLDQADIFIYQEDDMILRFTNIVEWVKQMYFLNQILAPHDMQDRTVGFFRYRRHNALHPPTFSAKDQENVRDAVEEDLINLEFIEEEPSVGYLCLGANQTAPYLYFGGNMHQAFWIFLREQLDYMQKKCSFLNQTMVENQSGTIEYMSDFSVWDTRPSKFNPLGGCGMTKMMPYQVERFVVHHYYPGARRTHHGHTMYNEIRRVYVGNRAFKGRIPPCWQPIVDNALKEEAAGI